MKILPSKELGTMGYVNFIWHFFSQLKIFFLLDGFGVQFELESTKKARLSVKKFNADGYGLLLSNFPNRFPPLTENFDLNVDFDLIIAASRIIEKVKNALQLADKAIEKLSQSFRVTELEDFPHGKLLINQTLVQGK